MRYSRQDIILKNLKKDFKGSENFHKLKIAIIGCGGIGSVLCDLLVRGGFLNLKLIDSDLIDETNLGRQNYYELDVGKSKPKVLKERLLKINSITKIDIVEKIINKDNIKLICQDCDLIVDATDNFETRKIINEYCVKTKKDWICNGAVKTEVFACIFYGIENKFEKVFPVDINNESCCDVGVLSSTVHISASISYNLILKYFIGIKENKLIKYDSWENTYFCINII